MALVKIVSVLVLLQCIHVLMANNFVTPDRPRYCYSCQGINCQRPEKENATTRCGDLLDICVTVFDGNAVTAKGCLANLAEKHRDKCTRNSPECTKCFGSLCNNKGRVDAKCVVCDTNDNSDCVFNLTDLPAVQCPSPTAENTYCFVRDSGVNDITRGCSVHLQDQLDCLKDEKCSLCLTSDAGKGACNSYEIAGIRSGASRSVLSISFGALFVLLALNLLK